MQDVLLHPWHNVTTLHPLGVALALVLGVAMFLLPRRQAVVAMLVMAIFVSPAQRIVVLTLDFNLLRLMVVAGWMRLIVRSEVGSIKIRGFDLIFVLWAVCGTAAYSLLHGTVEAFVNRAGVLFDAVGMYFLFRHLVRDWSDVVTIARGVAWLSLPIAVFFLIEKTTGRNLFAVFDGVPEYTRMRQDKLRCQGAFAHPILAGCFFAAVLPLVVSLWWRQGWDRVAAVAGVAGCLTVIITCTSTTPVVVMLVALFAGAAYAFRRRAKLVLGVGLVGVVLLQLAMANPIWHLLTRIDLAGGSTGWYRFLLIDTFVRRFEEWMLLGTRSTDGWWAYGMGDVTNQYVLQGISGGLVTLLLFLAVIFVAFAGVGRMVRAGAPSATGAAAGGRPSASRGRVPRRRNVAPGATSRRREVMAWAVGVSLLAHCAAFVAVSYFGQIIMLWYLTLAIIGSIAPLSRRRERRRRRRPAPVVPAPGWNARLPNPEAEPAS